MKRPQNRISSIKYDYENDKKGWVKFRNGTKIKLRKYVSDLATAMVKTNDVTYALNREFIIQLYNEGGLSAIVAWVRTQIEKD